MLGGDIRQFLRVFQRHYIEKNNQSEGKFLVVVFHLGEEKKKSRPCWRECTKHSVNPAGEKKRAEVYL